MGQITGLQCTILRVELPTITVSNRYLRMSLISYMNAKCSKHKSKGGTSMKIKCKKQNLQEFGDFWDAWQQTYQITMKIYLVKLLSISVPKSPIEVDS